MEHTTIISLTGDLERLRKCYAESQAQVRLLEAEVDKLRLRLFTRSENQEAQFYLIEDLLARNAELEEENRRLEKELGRERFVSEQLRRSTLYESHGRPTATAGSDTRPDESPAGPPCSGPGTSGE